MHWQNQQDPANQAGATRCFRSRSSTNGSLLWKILANHNMKLLNYKLSQHLVSQSCSCQIKADCFLRGTGHVLISGSNCFVFLFLVMQCLAHNMPFESCKVASCWFLYVRVIHVLCSAPLGQEVRAELRLAWVSLAPYCLLQVCQHHLWPAAESHSGQIISIPESTFRGAAQNTDWLWLV